MKRILPALLIVAFACNPKPKAVNEGEAVIAQTDNGALCFEYSDEVLLDYLNITFKGDSVYGSETGIIDDKAQAFHARYDSALRGVRIEGVLHMTVTTKLDGEEVVKKEVWHLEDGSLITPETTFKAVDCNKHYVL